MRVSRYLSKALSRQKGGPFGFRLISLKEAKEIEFEQFQAELDARGIVVSRDVSKAIWEGKSAPMPESSEKTSPQSDSSDDPTASYASFEDFLNSGRCRNKHQAEAVWAYWRRAAPERQPRALRTARLDDSRRFPVPAKVGIVALALAIVPLLWSQWYFSHAQVFRRFSDDLGHAVNRATKDAHLRYFKALGARTGYSNHHHSCTKTNCTFWYSHAFFIPTQATKDESFFLDVSIQAILWPSVSGVNRNLIFLSSTEWSLAGTDYYWKIESAKSSDGDLSSWRTLYSGNQNESYRAPESIRPLLIQTMQAIRQALQHPESLK